MQDCRFVRFRDITKTAVEIYIGKLQKGGPSATTAGHYLDSLKTFLNWAEADQRIIRNPVAKLDKPARDSEKKGVLEPEQFVHLVKTTSQRNVLIGKTSGQERAVLYLIAGMTGLRKKELLNLCWNDINLSGDNASVGVRASIAKHKKETDQPVPPILVSVLTALRASVRPNAGDRVFVSFNKSINTADLIREDLAVAGLELTDCKGRSKIAAGVGLISRHP